MAASIMKHFKQKQGSFHSFKHCCYCWKTYFMLPQIVGTGKAGGSQCVITDLCRRYSLKGAVLHITHPDMVMIMGWRLVTCIHVPRTAQTCQQFFVTHASSWRVT